jgi:DMSO/TMAO reductase YedYZ molybdopterin-dependent catalytic subunit
VSERDLLIVSEDPLNAETILERQTGPITPIGRHYVRTHFPIPDPPDEVVIDGDVRSPTTFSLHDVRRLSARTLAITLECAGNGRKFLDPSVPGEQWGLGAVGTAEWTGAPLRNVLERAAPLPGAIEVLFRGADEGVPKDLGTHIAYERSLPLADALGMDVLVAYAMNGAPIPREHGGPLRLVVPGWYGMASVKWLSRVTLLDRPFAGFYQKDRYAIDGKPLREIAPRSVIVAPRDGDTVGHSVRLRVYAWSGAAPIARLELSTDGGREWSDIPQSHLISEGGRYAWTRVDEENLLHPATQSRDLELVVRATDAAGNMQPLEPRWNALGYANNASRTVRVRVVRS